MNFEERLEQIAQNAKLKNKLCTLGICGIKGPTEPTSQSPFNPTFSYAIAFVSFSDTTEKVLLNLMEQN